MTRIVSYNILAGGYNMRDHNSRRTEQLVKMIRSVQPDVVGVVEAIHPQQKQTPMVIEEVAERLGMQFIPGGEPGSCTDFQLALLTRLPIVYTKIHKRPGIMSRPLLEVCVEEESGQHLVVCVTHLTAAFNRGRAGGHIRIREAREILRIMAPLRDQNIPHVLVGDFNSLAPGEPLRASNLLKYVTRLDTARKDGVLNDGHPHLNGVVPPQLRFLNPILRFVARSRAAGAFFDAAAYFYAPRGCIREIQEVYKDCFRFLHRRDEGLTCPAGAPAGRIDYMFANPALAMRLEECFVMTEGEGISGYEASDHLPVFAEFGEGILLNKPRTKLEDDKQVDSAVSR